MEINLNKEQLKDILISLYFTGFIKERHGIDNNNPAVLKHLIREMEALGLMEYIEFGKGKPYLSEALGKETMALVCKNDGEEVENIDITYDKVMEHLNQLVKEGKLIIPE